MLTLGSGFLEGRVGTVRADGNQNDENEGCLFFFFFFRVTKDTGMRSHN